MTGARFICLLGLLSGLLASSGVQANSYWSSLWRTPDQRGEQLLRQGDAAAAARTFKSPAHKAYAELMARDYAAAARDFATLDTSDAHYNRGNALAHSGDLKAALQAYDAALARDPHNRDARHNRELVARALKQTPPPPPAGQGQSGKPKPNAGSEQSSNKETAQSSAASRAGQNAPSGSPPPKGEPDSKPAPSAQGRPQTAPGRAGTSAPQANPANPNDSAQVRRDAEAGLAQQADKQVAGSPGAQASNTGRTAPLDAQPSEQQLAQEQWLRQIPDDPGGLLRRKFMIEHLIRQRGNQP